MSRKSYPTDLSDAEWRELEGLVPAPLAGGRPVTWSRREIVNALRYILRTGCVWRLLAHDFPPYQTVNDYFRQWRRRGVGERINTVLREKLRRGVGRAAQPSAVMSDVGIARICRHRGIF